MATHVTVTVTTANVVTTRGTAVVPSVTAVVNGAIGPRGATGAAGDDGEGVPTGGTTGQVLKKASDTDFDTEWDDESGGGGGGGLSDVTTTDGTTVNFSGAGTGASPLTAEVQAIANAHIAGGAAIALSKLATDPLARANHTGTQALATISDVTASAAEVNVLDGVTASTAELNFVDGVTSAIQTQLDTKAVDADVVHDTGNETIAGVKTFSSDPIIPDEAYGVGWNGSLEPPTKNAVYDKIETLGGGGGGTVDSVVAGTNIDVDATDPANPVVSVETLAVADISDLTASAAELNILDGATLTVTELNYVDGATSAIQTQLDAKAPLASPTFTGTPAAPTAAGGTNTTQVATTAFVKTAADAKVSDTAYDATSWNGVTDIAPSKNAVRDKIEAIPALTDGDKGDITVSSSGTVWTIDAGAVAPHELAGWSFNTQTGNYTLVLGDAGKVIEQNVASANNLTVPPNSSVAFPTGTEIFVVQYGAGATTIVAGSGVTLRALNGNLVLAGQYGWAKLVKRATDEWEVDIHGVVPGPRELQRAQGPTTAQTGISTVTDISQLTVTFTVANYPVDVILEPPFLWCSTNLVNGTVIISDNSGVAKARKALSCYASGAYSPSSVVTERITTPGTYTRKAQVERATGTGTINVSIGTLEAVYFGVLRVQEIAT